MPAPRCFSPKGFPSRWCRRSLATQASQSPWMCTRTSCLTCRRGPQRQWTTCSLTSRNCQSNCQSPWMISRGFSSARFLPAKPKKNEEPTSGLEPLTCSLRVIHHVLQGVAQMCKFRISRPVSLLCLALCCTVLRSRWCQSGIRCTFSPEFANSKKGISRLPLPPPQVRRRRPPRESSPVPCATPPPRLALPCPNAQGRCGRQLRRGSRCLWEYPLFGVRPALLPTAARSAPLLLLLQPHMQIPPRCSGLSGSVRSPMRVRGFLCRYRQPCRDLLGAGRSIPGCKDQ